MEAVKFLMLPLPAPLEVLRFRVRFRFQSLLSKCFRFRFHKNLTASTASAFTSLLIMKQLIVFGVKKQASLPCKLFYLTCVVDRVWYGMEDDFSIFHTGSFLPFHFILKIFPSILKFSSIFHSYFPCQRFWTGSKATNILLLCVFAML